MVPGLMPQRPHSRQPGQTRAEGMHCCHPQTLPRAQVAALVRGRAGGEVSPRNEAQRGSQAWRTKPSRQEFAKHRKRPGEKDRDAARGLAAVLPPKPRPGLSAGRPVAARLRESLSLVGALLPGRGIGKGLQGHAWARPPAEPPSWELVLNEQCAVA